MSNLNEYKQQKIFFIKIQKRKTANGDIRKDLEKDGNI